MYHDAVFSLSSSGLGIPELKTALTEYRSLRSPLQIIFETQSDGRFPSITAYSLYVLMAEKLALLYPVGVSRGKPHLTQVVSWLLHPQIETPLDIL